MLLFQSFCIFPCSLQAPWTHKLLLQVEMVKAALYHNIHTGKVIQLHNIDTSTVILISNASFMSVKSALLYLLMISGQIETIWCIDVHLPLHQKCVALCQISVLPVPRCAWKGQMAVPPLPMWRRYLVTHLDQLWPLRHVVSAMWTNSVCKNIK